MNNIENISNGKYTVTNYVSPVDGTNIKISNIPLPTIEIKNNCRAFFANKEYCITIKENNTFDITNEYIISLNIILKERFGKYKMQISDFIDNISLYLTVIYKNGINIKYSINNADIKINGSIINIIGNFDPETNLECVKEFRYQISNKKSIKLNKSDCIVYPYSGDAYISLNKKLNTYTIKMYKKGETNILFEGLFIIDINYKNTNDTNLKKITNFYETNNGITNYNNNILENGTGSGGYPSNDNLYNIKTNYFTFNGTNINSIVLQSKFPNSLITSNLYNDNNDYKLYQEIGGTSIFDIFIDVIIKNI